MALLLDSPHQTSLAFQVVNDDGQIVHARVDGRLAHRFPIPSIHSQWMACRLQREPATIGSAPEPNNDPNSAAALSPYDEPLAVAIGSEAYQRRVLLNLSAVTGMDTSGVNWLLTLQKRMDAAGGRLVLHSLSPAARNVVRVLKLHRALQVAVDETDAVQRM